MQQLETVCLNTAAGSAAQSKQMLTAEVDPFILEFKILRPLPNAIHLYLVCFSFCANTKNLVTLKCDTKQFDFPKILSVRTQK